MCAKRAQVDAGLRMVGGMSLLVDLFMRGVK